MINWEKLNNPNIRILNLGCGHDVREDAVNVDCAEGPGVDVVWDLDHNLKAWPFEESRFDQVLAIDILEHLSRPLLFLQNCWHALGHGYEMTIRVPHYTSLNFAVDPTHARSYDVRSFDYFDPSTELGMKYGHFYRNNCPWRLIKVEHDYLSGNITAVMRPIKETEVAGEWQNANNQ